MGLFSGRGSAVEIYEDHLDEQRSLTRSRQPFPVYATYTVGDLTADDALRLSAVFACVRLLARTVAQLPLVPYRRLDSGGRDRYSGRIADLLAAPAPGNVTYNLVSTIVAHLCLWGNAYVGKYRDDNGIVTQLAPLLPWGMTVTLDEGEPRYLYIDQQGAQQLGTADVLHFKEVSNDGIVGLSPIAQCSAGLRLEQSLGKHSDNFALNGGRPSGILRVGGWRSQQGTAPEDTRNDWETKFAGPDNAGKLLLLAGDEEISYTSLAMSMSDAEWVAQRQLSKAEIAAIFGLKSHLINAPVGDRLHYSSSEQDRLDLLTLAVQPTLTLIEQVLSADPDLSPSRTFCEFTVESLLRADSLTRAQFYASAIQAGWMTIEEVRLREGLSTTPPPVSPAQIPTSSPSLSNPLPPAPNPPPGDTP